MVSCSSYYLLYMYFQDLEGFDRKGWPHLWEIDELISQIPTFPPMVPRRGVVGHYIDRCMIIATYNSIVLDLFDMMMLHGVL